MRPLGPTASLPAVFWERRSQRTAASEIDYFLLHLRREEAVFIIVVEGTVFPKFTGSESSSSSSLDPARAAAGRDIRTASVSSSPVLPPVTVGQAFGCWRRSQACRSRKASCGIPHSLPQHNREELFPLCDDLSWPSGKNNRQENRANLKGLPEGDGHWTLPCKQPPSGPDQANVQACLLSS